MREYEITYLISDDLGESEITKATGRVAGLIAEHKGEVLKEETWGRRKLAYPIKKQTFATYITVNFKMDGAEIKPFERELFLTKEIIRHLLILKEFGKEKLELNVEDIAKTEDIEQVVGGEKSFEAVEGQTEESYDLMAKREEKAEETEELENQEIKKSEEDKEEISEDIKEVEKEEIEESKAEDKKDEAKAKKPVKKVKAKVTKKEEIEEKKEEPKTKKPAVKKKAKKDEKVEDEADRLAKLNKEIEDILGDDL